MQDIKGHVTIANQETLPILQEADGLLQQKREVESKQQLLRAFNQHFSLPDEDLAILTSSTIPMDDQFFSLLAKVNKVHDDCQVLLGSEDQNLGLELMDQTTRILNSAYEKLSRWIHKEFKTLDIENPRAYASIRHGLRVLAARPSLFQECLDFFAVAREHNLSEAFYGALTGSNLPNDNRNAKPLEYYAYDSLRFVGDMLAWLHSATISERESLEMLFVAGGQEIAKGLLQGLESEPWSQEDDQMFDGKKTLESLIDRDMTGVSKALRQRIEQVIKSDDDPVLAYKIANLISFYKVTLVRLVGSQSSLLENLETLKGSAMQKYRVSMNDYASAIPTDSGHVPPDLGPPDFLIDALARLQDILKSYEASHAAPECRKADLVTIVEEALDPFQKSCLQMSAELKEPSASVFVVNCLTIVRSTLQAQDFPASKIADLEDVIDDHSAKLIDYQHAFFRQTSGLQTLLVAIAPLTDSEEDLLMLYKLDAFQPQQLADSSQVLDDFLPSAIMDAGDSLKRLRDHEMAGEITAEAASRFCEDFDQVEERLVAADAVLEASENVQDYEDGKPAPLRSIFQRTSGEIRVLLS